MSTIFEKVTQELEKLDLGEFRSTSDRVKLVQEVSSKLDLIGGTFVKKGLNTEANVLEEIKRVAPKYLQARTVGRYIPRFPDNLGKTSDELRHLRQENFRALQKYAEAKGYVWKDKAKAQEALDSFSQGYHIEWNDQKEPVARQIVRGMYSAPKPLKEVIDSKLFELADQEETSWRQLEIKAGYRKKATELLGFSGQLDKRQQEALDNMTSRVQKRAERGDDYLSDKPRATPDVMAYRAAVTARELHNLGHESMDTMNLSEQRHLKGKVDATMRELGYGGG